MNVSWIGILFTYFISFWLGYELLLALIGKGKKVLNLSLLFSLSPAMGMACTSLLLSLALFLGLGLPFTVLLMIHTSIAVVLFSLRRKSGVKPAYWGGTLKEILIFSAILALTFLLVTGVIFKSPYGNGLDVWAIWKLKARFIYFSPEEWQKIFTPDLYYSHPDYPLLYPLLIVWGWLGVGHESQAAVWLIALVTAIASTTLLFTVRSEKRPNFSIVSVLFLLSTPQWVGMASSLYADTLLSYFILSVMVLIHEGISKREQRMVLAAGFLAGAGTYVKNEGWLFVAAIALSLLCWSFLSHKETKEFKRQFFLNILIGSLPMIALSAALKWFSSTPSHMLSLQGIVQTLQPEIFMGRLKVIFTAILSQVFNENAWVYTWFILGWVAFIYRKKIFCRDKIAFWLPLIFLNLGYILIYLQTPLDLTMLLNTSLDRLMIHSFPVLVFIVFRGAAEAD